MKHALTNALLALGMTSLFTAGALAGASGQPIVLAENGTAKCTIVLADEAIEPEQTAASELAEYFKKVTGAEFTIVKEGQDPKTGTRIYVGPTEYARKQGIVTELLGPERWYMRSSSDGNLILAGGRPRGTIYAAYHFLEDVVGIHWWSPWEEYVPSQTNLSIAALDRHGEPVFRNRCLDVANYFFGDETFPFAARSKINRLVANRSITFKYGGGASFGPPALVHTEGQFIYRYKKDFSFKRNPEWFAMKDGKRWVFNNQSGWSSKNQLCLSNPKLRQAFLKKLKENIAETRDQPCPPMIFDVSLNDVPTLCQCDSCQAAIKKYGGIDTGLLLEFVNYMADGIKDDYPGVMVETLAYLNTERVPKGIVPRANVIVTLCDTKSTYTKPIAHDEYLVQRLAAWSKITNNIFVWDYHTNFVDMALPMPFESTFQPDLQLFRKYNVVGVMSEYHYPIFEELRDLRLWLLAKLLEDPYQNQATLIETFTDGFYGPAGVHVRRYIEELSKAAKASPGYMTTAGKTAGLKYLSPPFVLKAQEFFAEAEKAVDGSETLLRRVRHARMAIDKATLALFSRIWGEWKADGKKEEDLPLNREEIAARLRDTVEAQWRLRVDPEALAASTYRAKKVAARKTKFFTKVDKYLKQSLIAINPPAKFEHLPWEDYTAYAADTFGIYALDGKKAEVVEDRQTQNGIACRTELSVKAIDALDGNALKWDMHDHAKKHTGKEAAIKYLKLAEIVPGTGYHWYKLGTYQISENNFIWMYGVNLGIELGDARDPLNPAGEYDVWARARFDGPEFRGDEEKAGPNAISIEWVVAVKKGKI